MTTVQVYYTDNLMWEYVKAGPEPTYTLVHQGSFTLGDASIAAMTPTETDQAMCDILFHLYNRGAGDDEMLNRLKLRSMSMGDIVKLVDEADEDWAEHERLRNEGHLPDPCGPACPRPRRSRAYRCASVGWDPVESWTIAEEVT